MMGNLKFEHLGNYEVKSVVAQRRHGVLFEGMTPLMIVLCCLMSGLTWRWMAICVNALSSIPTS